MARRKKQEEIKEQPKAKPLPVFFIGLFLFALGLFLGLSFATADITVDPVQTARQCATGLVGAWVAYGTVLTLGLTASYFMAGLVCMWGVCVMQNREFFSTWPKVLGGVVMTVSVAMLSSALTKEVQLSGGIAAHVLAPPMQLYVGSAGLVIIAFGTLFLGAVMSFGHAAFELTHIVWDHLKTIGIRTASVIASIMGGIVMKLRPRVAEAVAGSASRALVIADKAKQRMLTPADEDKAIATAVEVEAAVIFDEPAPVAVVEPEPEMEPEPEPEPEPVVIDEHDFTPYGIEEEEMEEEFAPKTTYKKPKKPKKEAAPEKLDKIEVDSRTEAKDYQLPPLNLLQEPVEGTGDGISSLEKRGKVLEQTLSEFKIDGRVVAIECGPRITLFEIRLAAGIRVNKVINLADNIAMALKAPNVRIIAPIPGKDTVGIEIPNLEQQLVTLREVMEAVNRENRKQALPLCLSKDVSGKPVIADLAKMPHLLIAGSTGSGKSVCINSVLLSFLMCCKPQDVKYILIDPKVVELSRFKDTPHLMSPVITDMKKAVGVLEWACMKMDERYEQLSMVSVNNISKFNALGDEEIAKRLDGIYSEDELSLFPKHLPYIVIVIDELADLMMVAGKDVEQHITRLAAKSRAVGIHLILATQRPSVDVITGLIKANMPSRIAFQVASRVDSRTILDQNGAETLLGAGDMLYLPPGVGKVIRSQGVFV
ncbi:MAG: DNA translocase FtsK, partial [Planctomycetes bacterium]|nr:DNA translocase FtsK [Planctomycetota bacterium]